MDIEGNINRHECSIGRRIGWYSGIEGKLESLATKDFVRQEVNEAVKVIDAKIDAKIDAQSNDLSDQIEQLSNKIDQERSWRMRVTGAASIIALVLVGLSSLVSTLATLGIIPTD